MRKKIYLIIILTFVLLAACSGESDYLRGYDDGYADGQQDLDNIDKGKLIDYLEDNEYMVFDESMTAEMSDYLTDHGYVVLDEDEANEYNLNDMLNSTTYIGNAGSMKFHKATCSSVMDMDEKNKVYNDSYDYFIEKGYEPCKKCNP